MLHNNIDVMYTGNYEGIKSLPLFDHSIVFSRKQENVCASIMTRGYKATLGALADAGPSYNVFMEKYKKKISAIAGGFCSELKTCLNEYSDVVDGTNIMLHTGILENDKCFIVIANNFMDDLVKDVPYHIYKEAEAIINMFVKRLNVLSTFVTLSVDVMYYDIVNDAGTKSESKKREYRETC